MYFYFKVKRIIDIRIVYLKTNVHRIYNKAYPVLLKRFRNNKKLNQKRLFENFYVQMQWTWLLKGFILKDVRDWNKTLGTIKADKKKCPTRRLAVCHCYWFNSCTHLNTVLHYLTSHTLLTHVFPFYTVYFLFYFTSFNICHTSSVTRQHKKHAKINNVT